MYIVSYHGDQCWVLYLCTCIVLIHVMLFQYLELLFLCYRHYKYKIDCQKQKLGVMICRKIYVEMANTTWFHISIQCYSVVYVSFCLSISVSAFLRIKRVHIDITICRSITNGDWTTASIFWMLLMYLYTDCYCGVFNVRLSDIV